MCYIAGIVEIGPHFNWESKVTNDTVVIPCDMQSYTISQIMLARAWTHKSYERLHWFVAALLNEVPIEDLHHHCDKCGVRVLQWVQVLENVKLCWPCAQTVAQQISVDMN